MKHIHKFDNFLNEKLTDKMTPVTDDDIINKLKESDKNHASIISTIFYKKNFDLLSKIINSDVELSQDGLNELLSLACRYGHKDLVEYSIEKGADLQQWKNSSYEATDLLVLAHEYDDILSILVQSGLDPEETIERAEENEYFNNTQYYEIIIDLIYKFNLEDEFYGIIYNYEEHYKPNM